MSFVVVVVVDDDVEMYQKNVIQKWWDLLYFVGIIIYSILIVGLMILIQKRRIKLIMD